MQAILPKMQPPLWMWRVVLRDGMITLVYTRGHFELESTLYIFQRVKLSIITRFHVSITIYTKRIHNSVLEAWGRYTSLKIE